MSKKVSEAYAAYKSATSPVAIRKALSTFRRLGYGDLITAKDIRDSALLTLQESLAHAA